MVKLILLSLIIDFIGLLDASISEWNSFKAAHFRKYKSAGEENHRYLIFKSNLDRINLHNERYAKGLETYTQGINKFADKTENEYREITSSYVLPREFYPNVTVEQYFPGQPSPPPANVDWRNRPNTISPPKQQSTCDSCWAFSATGAIEAHYAIYKNQQLSLSEQQLVDCVKSNKGCRGGWPVYALYYVKDKGITSDSQYPYTATEGTCRYDANTKVASVTGVVETEKNSEQALQIAVAKKGPVAIAFDGGVASFAAYTSGIFSAGDCVPTRLSHAALIIGYGTNSGIDFWIGKNCYGVNWGERGYFRIRRNVNNMCGVASAPCYPTV